MHVFGQWGVGCKVQRRIQESSIFPSLEFTCSRKRQSVFLSFVEMSKALRTGSIISPKRTGIWPYTPMHWPTELVAYMHCICILYLRWLWQRLLEAFRVLIQCNVLWVTNSALWRWRVKEVANPERSKKSLASSCWLIVLFISEVYTVYKLIWITVVNL